MKTPSYKFRLTMFTLMLMALMASFVPPAHAGLFGMSEQDEIKAGEQVRQQAIKEYGQPLPDNDPRSIRVRRIGQQFAALSTRKTIPYSYTVLNNNEVLNAFAAPGGPIFVTTKLIDTTANDAELAYVLGHETGHIERKHIVKSVEKQQKAGLLAGVLGAIFGGGKGGNVVGTIANVGWAVVSSGYSRDDEIEADVTGARWMSQLGYDPRAAISMLGKLGGGQGGLAKYLASHPDPKDRQTTIQNLIQKENLMDVARRQGGPKLNMNGGNDVYNNTSYPNNNSNPPAYYPPTNDANNPPAYSPPDATPNNSLTAPLVIVNRGGQKIVLGPVEDLARWAGARSSTRNGTTIFQRGHTSLELRRNSTVARVNGRNVEMSAAADNYNNQLYAPVGNIADGLGAKASLVDGNRSVRLTLGGQTLSMRLP